MTERRDILNTADIPIRTLHSGPRFEAALGDIDGAVRTTQIGGTPHVVPAGKTAWPFHRHHGNDEIFYVVAGEGTYRVGERRLPIKPGDLRGRRRSIGHIRIRHHLVAGRRGVAQSIHHYPRIAPTAVLAFGDVQ